MYLSEWFIVCSYAKSVYEKRNKLSVFFTVILYIIVMLIYKFVTTTEIFNVLFTLLCHILCFYIGFRSTLKSSLFHGLILAITQFVSEVIAIYIISFVSNSTNDSYIENSIIYMYDVIISKILFFSISRFLLKFSNQENPEKSWGRWFFLSILPLSSLFIIMVMRLLTNGQKFSFFESVICVLSISSLLIANIVVYLIYERAEKSNQKLIELELINQKNDNDMQYLELLEKKNEQMQIMTHDYKNNVLTIASMTDSVELKEYINSMVGEIKKYNQLAKTKNRLLDVILNKYTDICDNKNLIFETDIMTDNLSFIDGYDISSLFNNILDNAVEAAEKSKDRFLSLSISTSLNSYHKITVINSCDTKPETKNGKLITSKADKSTHGLGTKSINKIVTKYGGELQWEYNASENIFKLTIVIPIECTNNSHPLENL